MPSRCLTLSQAAEYCGLTPSGFLSWVSRGIVPGPIPGTRRWDKKAIDQALDRASGLSQADKRDEAAAAYEAWRARREAANAHEAEAHQDRADAAG